MTLQQRLKHALAELKLISQAIKHSLERSLRSKTLRRIRSRVVDKGFRLQTSCVTRFFSYGEANKGALRVGLVRRN